MKILTLKSSDRIPSADQTPTRASDAVLSDVMSRQLAIVELLRNKTSPPVDFSPTNEKANPTLPHSQPKNKTLPAESAQEKLNPPELTRDKTIRLEKNRQTSETLRNNYLDIKLAERPK